MYSAYKIILNVQGSSDTSGSTSLEFNKVDIFQFSPLYFFEEAYDIMNFTDRQRCTKIDILGFSGQIPPGHSVFCCFVKPFFLPVFVVARFLAEVFDDILIDKVRTYDTVYSGMVR